MMHGQRNVELFILGSVKRQTHKKYRLSFVFIDLLRYISICACSYRTCLDSHYSFTSRSHLVPHRGERWNKKQLAQNCTDYPAKCRFLSFVLTCLALYRKHSAIFWVPFRFYSNFVAVHKRILFFPCSSAGHFFLTEISVQWFFGWNLVFLSP
jgi:hypothetical protein